MSESQGPSGALDPHSYSGVFGVPQMKPYNELLKWETQDSRVVDSYQEMRYVDYPTWELGYDARSDASQNDRDTHYRPWEKPPKQESQSDNENKTPPTLTQLTNAFPAQTYTPHQEYQKLPSFQSQFTSFPPEPQPAAPPPPPPPPVDQYNRTYTTMQPHHQGFMEDPMMTTRQVHGIVFQNNSFPNYNGYNVIPATVQEIIPTELPASLNNLLDQNGYKIDKKKKRVQKKEIHQVDQVSTSTHDFKKPSSHHHVIQDKNNVKKKRKRCGECIGCQRKDNCGECAPCRNDKSHQICKQRRCDKLTEKKTPKSKMKQQQQQQ